MPRLLNARRPSVALATVVALVMPAGCATAPRVTTTAIAVVAPVDGADLQQILARADSAWLAESYPLAASLYEAAVARDSTSSRPVFRLATLRAWSDRSEEAERLFRLYVKLEPRDTEGRLALARALGWAAKYSAAIAIYDSVIAQDSTYRDAVVGRAQTLSWAGRSKEGLEAYRQWVVAHPLDHPAFVEYARALSWNGQFDDAEKIYSFLAGMGDADAKKGLARVAAWRGDLQRSVDGWQAVLSTRPNDVEALTGLAQVLHWHGREADAAAALRLALATNPGYGDARALIRWVDAALRPRVSMHAYGTEDSDDNRIRTLVLDYETLAAVNATVGGRYTGRRAEFPATDSRSDAATALVRWQPRSWRLRAEGGVARLSSTRVRPTGKASTFAHARLHASGLVVPALTLRLDAATAPFDETALLIANGIVSSELGGEAEWRLPARFELTGAASHARLMGGSRDNARRAWSSTLRWNYNRRWSAGVGVRRFGYDTSSTDGYFSPREYTLGEVSGRGRVGAQLGWNADADVGVGRQRIEFFGFSAGSRRAERAALSAGYRFDPAREVTLSARYANVAGPGQTGPSEYRVYTIGLMARLGL